MVKYQKIEALVKANPGLTEKQIAVHLHGAGAVQQKVNADCRWLVSQGRIKRKGFGGRGDPYRCYA
jgi:hypothetical protein